MIYNVVGGVSLFLKRKGLFNKHERGDSYTIISIGLNPFFRGLIF